MAQDKLNTKPRFYFATLVSGDGLSTSLRLAGEPPLIIRRALMLPLRLVGPDDESSIFGRYREYRRHRYSDMSDDGQLVQVEYREVVT